MKKIDLANMAKSNLIRHKLRTSLTVLGIVIGAVSIILMVALGSSLQASVSKSFESFGSLNNIEVYPNTNGINANNNVRKSEVTEQKLLNNLDVAEVENIEGVSAVIPTLSINAKLKSGKYESNVQIIGIKPEHLDKMSLKIGEGKLDISGNKNAAVFNSKAVEKFSATSGSDFYGDMYYEGMDGGPFGGAVQEVNYNVDIFKERIEMTTSTDVDEYDEDTGKLIEDKDPIIQEYSIYPTGILKSERYSFSSQVYMPLDTVRQMLKDIAKVKGERYKDEYQSFTVVVNDISKVLEMTNKIKQRGYLAYSGQSELKSVNQVLGVVQMVLGGIGGISLLVAAIGITNTMVMAVTERKKEIGVMKVIGATIGDIKQLFLLESALIGMVGGVIGTTISLGLAGIANQILVPMMGPDSNFNVIIPIWLIFASIGFTTLIGVMSGYLPARKAMKASALEALRNE